MHTEEKSKATTRHDMLLKFSLKKEYLVKRKKELTQGSDYLEVPYLREKKLFGGTVPPGKKIIWRYPKEKA